MGKIGLLKWEFAGQKPGHLEQFLPAGLENEMIINFIPLPEKKDISLGLISSDGKFKRILINEINDISNRSASILKLKDNIKLKSCILCKENSYLYVISDIGRIIKLKITEKNFPFMGKSAQGTSIIKLFPDENIIDALSLQEKEQNKELKEKVKELEESLKKLTKENNLFETTIYKLNEKLQKTLLSNSKLLYSNRVLGDASLNERQKIKIVEAIAKARSVEEAKNLQETLKATVGSNRNDGPQSLSESVQRKSNLSSMFPRRKKQEQQVEVFSDRMKKLAGIN